VTATNSLGSVSQLFTLTIDPGLSCDAPVRIMPLGDSITVGSSSGVADAAQYISYRKDLWESLLAAGHFVDFVGSAINGQFYEGFDPDHEGHGGYRDDQVARNIYNNSKINWLGHNPADIILLHIGTNSLNSSPNDVEKILNEIDQFESDRGVRVIVILARIINRNTHSSITTLFNNNVQAMAEARIAAGDSIVIVDMENGAGINYNLLPVGDMWDNLHPFATGYTKMANVWFNALTPILPVCSAP
jgi:hypothetical protein